VHGRRLAWQIFEQRAQPRDDRLEAKAPIACGGIISGLPPGPDQGEDGAIEPVSSEQCHRSFAAIKEQASN
jgi:hypothetical protein